MTCPVCSARQIRLVGKRRWFVCGSVFIVQPGRVGVQNPCPRTDDGLGLELADIPQDQPAVTSITSSS